MRFLARIVLGALVLAGLLLVVGMFLPREVTVRRGIEIDAPPATVYAALDSMQDFVRWSPWSERDPDLVQRFEGPEEGVGNVMVWESDVLGDGRQEIVSVLENQRVETALDFGDMGTAEAVWVVDRIATGSYLSWSLKTDMGGNPAMRWMGLMMDRWVGADYEAGLANLKAQLEGASPADG